MSNTSKRIISVILVAALAFAGLSGCNTAEDSTQPNSGEGSVSTEWKWERNIEIMTPGSLGGGLDLTLRAFAPLLEKELGVSVIIDNRPGAGQVAGWTYAYTQPRDGYLFEFSTPSFVGSAASGSFSVPIMDELVSVCGLVQADAIIFANPDNGKFTDLQSMVDYVQEHPGEVSCAIDTPQGVAGAALTQFAEGIGGFELNWVSSGSDDSITSVLAGDVDTLVANWTDCGAYVESGDLIAICTLSENQLDVLPDVPSSASIGAPVSIGFYRGFFAFEGTPQEAVDAFAAAVYKVATTSPEWAEYLENNALNNDYLWDGATLDTKVQESYDAFSELMGLS